MTDRTPLVRSTVVPGDEDSHLSVRATIRAAPSLPGVLPSSVISSIAGATSGDDPSSPDDDVVAGKTVVLLMANHKVHGTNVNRSR